ncbi:MAG: hypothetical protein A2288_02935 [Candidatus Moranbacteria bacterium RIFOXYA12_FULL_44_15]|nr:MAG: hypothetical protein A2288_02935 [Candidatus Moranbacteria bacterium RIFOXYA12_FULL_44_15]OGI36322.1 MAG: hypothetical protein A2259_00115 [Candidatus Moranbacteria bacterium RIFOXYA2_FULL_43_15]
MKLRGIEFGNPFVASGTLNFFGEGWQPHHQYRRVLFPRGFDFSGATLITKTTTLNSRMPTSIEKGKGKGNLVLNLKTLQPAELLPDCIKVNFLTGEALNSVGLTGPGARALFERGLWQKMTRPFLLSFMAVGASKEQRLEETRDFVKIFHQYLPSFRAKVALEINISCPNTEHCSLTLAEEAIDQLKATDILGIPQGVKINVLTSIDSMKRVADSGYCDFIDIPNTLAFGQLSHEVDWFSKYGGTSPLAKYGGGGYSGRENFELAARWVQKFRRENSEMNIILGGIFCKDDVVIANQVKADAISFGRLSMTRPWRVANIIKKAKQIFGGE